MFCMIILCRLLFQLIHKASPAVFSMSVLNLSTRRLVTTVEFANAPSSLTLTHLHRYFLFLNVVSMKRTVLTGDVLDAVLNTQSVLVLAHTTLSMKLNARVEVMQ